MAANILLFDIEDDLTALLPPSSDLFDSSQEVSKELEDDRAHR